MADFDTQLFLFDNKGRGVVSNDDFNCTLQSFIADPFLCAGCYFLAITAWDNDPRDPFELRLFDNLLSTFIVPSKSGPIARIVSTPL